MSLVGSYGTQHHLHVPHHHHHHHLLMGTTTASGSPPGSSPHDPLYSPHSAYYAPHPSLHPAAVHPYPPPHHHHHHHGGMHHLQQQSDGFLAPSPASSSASSPPSLEDHQGPFYTSGPWGPPATPTAYAGCNTPAPSTPSACAPAPSTPTSPEAAFQDYEYQQQHLSGHYQVLQHPSSLQGHSYRLQGQQQGQQPAQQQQQQPGCQDVPQMGVGPPTFVRVVKRRNTANKKERRRTQSINTAFADLRDCIPNVPSDTKLSKIKTLRLATSYIAYLMGVLSSEDPNASEVGFKAEIMQQQQQGKKASLSAGGAVALAEEEDHKRPCDGESERRRGEQGLIPSAVSSGSTERKVKGRTGWPQHVWALELKP